MSIPVFRKGSWVQYPIPPAVDSVWSQQHLYIAASFYATALSQGYNSSESASLAECYVNKQVYPELIYARQIEQKLSRITREQHESP